MIYKTGTYVSVLVFFPVMVSLCSSGCPEKLLFIKVGLELIEICLPGTFRRQVLAGEYGWPEGLCYDLVPVRAMFPDGSHHLNCHFILLLPAMSCSNPEYLPCYKLWTKMNHSSHKLVPVRYWFTAMIKVINIHVKSTFYFVQNKIYISPEVICLCLDTC